VLKQFLLILARNALHGAAAGGTDQERWDFWGRFMQPLIATRPHQAVAGNHEIETVRASFSSAIHPTHLTDVVG